MKKQETRTASVFAVCEPYEAPSHYFASRSDAEVWITHQVAIRNAYWWYNFGDTEGFITPALFECYEVAITTLAEVHAEFAEANANFVTYALGE